MDLSHPLRAVVPSLDASVLEVLAGTSRPLSGSEVARLAGRGSPSGIRLVLKRLAEHGLARRENRRSVVYYSANRDHIAWPSVVLLTQLYEELHRRVQCLVQSWDVQPTALVLYGSAARRDGATGSDVDLLMVRPSCDEPLIWDRQRDGLSASVEAWTGNRAHIYELDVNELHEHVTGGEPIVTRWRDEGRTLAGQDIRTLIRRATA